MPHNITPQSEHPLPATATTTQHTGNALGDGTVPSNRVAIQLQL